MSIEIIQTTLPSGSSVSAALARAARADAPGLILIHEWWGLLDETKAMAERLALQGYNTLAVDLYGGKASLDPAVAGELMNGVDPLKAGANLSTWNTWLREHGARKVGTLGFCFGGTWSLNASLVAPVDATVIFYGGVARPAEDLAALRGPVLAHFGSKDNVIPQNSAQQLEAALAQAGKAGDVYTYLADHAFAREGGPNYEPGAAALAWQRTDAFLRKYLEVATGTAAYTPPSRQASFSEIPVISIASLGSADAAEAATIEAIRKASEEVGFFYITDYGIEPAKMRDIFEQCRRLYDLPTAELQKMRLANSPCFAGYLSVGERGANANRPRDLLEAFNVCTELPPDDPFVTKKIPLHGANQWPASLPGFRDSVLDYYRAMDKLGARLLQAFAMALGLDRDALNDQYRKPISQLRLLHYPAQDQAVDEMMGARSHRDVGMFTILLQDNVGGLEVCNAAGEWIVAPPIENTLIVNVGEMMKLLTNDHFASALHRVVNRSNRQRFSVPYFFNPDYNTQLSTLAQYIDEAHPAQFKPIHVGEHMFNFYRNLWPNTAAGAAE
jgi:isopenicillin N synthase-like dioxygenase/dienelactone hydrolase